MRNYGEPDLKEDLRKLITLAVTKRQCLLFSDADIKHECFLEYINNLLNVGVIPALFSEDQKDDLIGIIKGSARVDETREDSLWSYAMNRARDNLHIILAISPSGDTLRNRCRSFPGLISCTSVDWFQPWPLNALSAVARALLQHEDLPQKHCSAIEEHIVGVHASVTTVYAPDFERKCGRTAFSTPKNYLDFLKTYKGMLQAKRYSIHQLSTRLEGGLQKMNTAAESVKIMNAQVEAKKAVVDEKKRSIEELIRSINEKSIKATQRREEARATEMQISQDQITINQEKASADDALAAAIPALEAAARALENIDKKDITEIKAFTSPPKPVMNVCMCVVILRPLGRENEADGWNGAKSMLNDVNFLKSLVEYPKDNITERQVRKLAEYFSKDPDSFSSEKMAKVSKAGNGLLTWVKAMVEYHEVAKGVEPKRRLVAELQQKQDEAGVNLARIRIYEEWCSRVVQSGIPVRNPFKIECLLTTEADIVQWNSEGLPANEMSIQNGILTTMSSRWPLCIDPQLQAVKWIKQREEDRGLVAKAFTDDYMKYLELAIQYGKPFLFESIETDIDPSIDPVLERSLVIQNGQKVVTLLGKQVDWNDGFCLYLTTKLSNPKFSPEIMNKANVINYQVTITGLADQMLAIVVGNEVPDLEHQRQDLIRRMSESRLMLKQLENTLLHELAHSKGNPLDNEDLIDTLQSTKTKALEIENFLEEAKSTAAKIEEKRQEFYCVAKRGSVVYFSMDGMKNVSPMLEYSLDAFLHTFRVALREARQDRILENRLKSLSDKVTQLSYDYISLVMIMRYDGKLSEEELDFFLKGSNTISEDSSKPEELIWVPDSGWNDLQKIDKLSSNFRGLLGHVLSESQVYLALPCGRNKFRSLSIGQGMGEQAKQLVETGYQRGLWIMLQNCHLLPAWLATLAKLLQEMKKPHPRFRLWLTTQPTNAFPLSILQDSLKVVTEPPEGIRANMQGSYALLRDDKIEQCQHPSYPTLVYALSFLHAVVQERRKYGKIGWNVPYDFNESDLSISLSLVKMYLGKTVGTSASICHTSGEHSEDTQSATLSHLPADIPWKTLRFLIGEIVYGGRVTDEYDRRVLVTYLEEYLGEFIFDSYRRFSFSKAPFSYTLPSDNSSAGHIEFIKGMPASSNPEVFGLHPNAEIGYFVENAKSIWHGLLKINITCHSGNKGDSALGNLKETTLVATISEIFEKVPSKPLYFCPDSDPPTPIEIVLAQELDRLNILLQAVIQSLRELRHALRGDIGMSMDLDELALSLQAGVLPRQWRALAPPTSKSLGSWISHLMRRIIELPDDFTLSTVQVITDA
ncbi:dynein heavy chain 10 related protein [Cyclospora cayetanensis]|uniref:Dynein heavy chain 10 related protein n=1 Tax=Cyclospora cayetanensis TaxID=88456 RepID=A0A1D3CX35_9EIME|nr:dynein heavy chain 10 related protein [Cyclospora cayetanensis]